MDAIIEMKMTIKKMERES
jgi:charged multivesicular body protein 1